MNFLKNLITNVVLRTLGNNLDHLIDFLNRLDDRIDAYVAAQDAKVKEINDAIEALRRLALACEREHLAVVKNA